MKLNIILGSDCLYTKPLYNTIDGIQGKKRVSYTTLLYPNKNMYTEKKKNNIMTTNGHFPIYRIRPYYHTVCIGFSKLLETPCSKISTW